MYEPELQVRAAQAIDTEWHYSWHWEHSENGYVTTTGFQTALRDARKRLMDISEDEERLRRIISEIENALIAEADKG